MKIRPRNWNPNIVYARYIVTYNTPQIINMNFEPKEGVMSRYAAKMVDTKYYYNPKAEKELIKELEKYIYDK